jgi:hypothetical protein
MIVNHNTKTGAYTDSKRVPRGPSNPGDGAGSPKQLDVKEIYEHGTAGGSAKLPRNA